MPLLIECTSICDVFCCEGVHGLFYWSTDALLSPGQVECRRIMYKSELVGVATFSSKSSASITFRLHQVALFRCKQRSQMPGIGHICSLTLTLTFRHVKQPLGFGITAITSLRLWHDQDVIDFCYTHKSMNSSLYNILAISISGANSDLCRLSDYVALQ